MSLRVLVVDDSPEMRQLLRFVLSRDARFEVVGEAGDGSEGVALAAALRPDLILLDLRMPVMDGFEALPLLRQRAPGSRVIVVSGVSAREAEGRALALGAAGYIEKDASASRFREQLLALADDAPAPGSFKA